jgi:hypothetical protein
MAVGRQADRQGDLVVTWKEMSRSPGHVFYDRLQGVLIDAGFGPRQCCPVRQLPRLAIVVRHHSLALVVLLLLERRR